MDDGRLQVLICDPIVGIRNMYRRESDVAQHMVQSLLVQSAYRCPHLPAQIDHGPIKGIPESSER
jgi:hypothetical protein